MGTRAVRVVAACVALVLWGGVATAQVIEQIWPTELAPRDRLVIAGSELLAAGGQRPAVFALTPDGLRKRLRITYADDGFVEVLTPPLDAGSYGLQLRFGGGHLLSLPDAFALVPPQPVEFVGGQAIVGPGHELDLRLNHIGPRRGSVTIGGLRAKVIAWKPWADSSYLGHYDRVVVRVPRGLAPGGHTVHVHTSTGSAMFPEQLLVPVDSAPQLAVHAPALDAYLADATPMLPLHVSAFDAEGPATLEVWLAYMDGEPIDDILLLEGGEQLQTELDLSPWAGGKVGLRVVARDAAGKTDEWISPWMRVFVAPLLERAFDTPGTVSHLGEGALVAAHHDHVVERVAAALDVGRFEPIPLVPGLEITYARAWNTGVLYELEPAWGGVSPHEGWWSWQPGGTPQPISNKGWSPNEVFGELNGDWAVWKETSPTRLKWQHLPSGKHGKVVAGGVPQYGFDDQGHVVYRQDGSLWSWTKEAGSSLLLAEASDVHDILVDGPRVLYLRDKWGDDPRLVWFEGGVETTLVEWPWTPYWSPPYYALRDGWAAWIERVDADTVACRRLSPQGVIDESDPLPYASIQALGPDGRVLLTGARTWVVTPNGELHDVGPDMAEGVWGGDAFYLSHGAAVYRVLVP